MLFEFLTKYTKRKLKFENTALHRFRRYIRTILRYPNKKAEVQKQKLLFVPKDYILRSDIETTRSNHRFFRR